MGAPPRVHDGATAIGVAGSASPRHSLERHHHASEVHPGDVVGRRRRPQLHRRGGSRRPLVASDAEIDRESGLALFDTFASEDKTLHAFPGSHFRVPAERIDTRFFERQFGNAAVGVGASS